MAKEDLTDALPGFESIVPVSDDVDMQDGQRFTAEVLCRDHRAKFERVCKLMFQAGLSDAMIAGIERVSRNTVRAIRDMVVDGAATPTAAAAAALFCKTRATNSRKLIQLRALEAVRERLESSPDDLSIEQLMDVVKFAAGESDQPEESTMRPASAEVIDVDGYDAMLDGLQGEKKRAGEGVCDGVAGDGREGVRVGDGVLPDGGGACSTGSDSVNGTHSNRVP